jgi:hypothetical protein
MPGARMPGARMYVVNSTALITYVQRQSKTLAFAPIEVKAILKTMDVSEATKAILRENMDEKEAIHQPYIVSFKRLFIPPYPQVLVSMPLIERQSKKLQSH